MSKELEALNIIKFNPDDVDALQYLEAFKVVEKAIQRLKSIENSNPSEALECLEKLELLTCNIEWYKDNINTIKQALIKAQEQEKVLKIIYEKNVDVFSLKKCIELDLPLTDVQRLHKYNHDYMMIGMEQLTQEEFNTLKEMLK